MDITTLYLSKNWTPEALGMLSFVPDDLRARVKEISERDALPNEENIVRIADLEAACRLFNMDLWEMMLE